MRRTLFTLAAALCAVLCVGACVLWVRGYMAYDEIQWTRASNAGGRHYAWYFTLASGRGRLAAALDAEISYPDSLTPAEGARPLDCWSSAVHVQRPPAYPQPFAPRAASTRGGFAVLWVSDPATVARDVIVPAWFVVLSTAIPPALWLRHEARRRHTARAGCCRRCGYDLRATPDRFPEFGRAAAANGAA
jgi:hypothetical protein